MEESSTYQWVLEQGRQEGARRELQKTLLLMGHKQFQGTPQSVKAAIEAITDVARLEELSVQLLEATSWQELLGLTEAGRRSTRRKPKA